ncbi:hypothetical protein GQX73_g10077 [Xylaria multiplex]|uniref:Tethering factor for nuclear proteasome STS1 n=1 Tax=Xylaria multiplex TaxID=323545 RepID=A0A7C8MR55_9PEZI|nr:hypothetical protein GQX73_g10077 [Xylaria multiplex]
MAGTSSSQLAPADVMAAMMDDLGNHRLEELARDDGRVPRNGLVPLTNTSTHTGQDKPRTGGARRNSLAERYHAAIEDGLFNDDDAAGVNNLDPLDNGNAHRIKDRPFGQAQHEVQAPGVTGNSKRSRYDPSQPTFRNRTDKLRSRDPNVNSPARASTSNSSNRVPRVSPLGAIVLDGSASQGRPISSHKDIPSAQSTQTTSRDRGHGRSLPKPPRMTGTGHNALRGPREVDQGLSKLTHPQQPPTNGSLPVNTTVGEPQRAASLPLTSATGSASESRHSWEPPHLRRKTGNTFASSAASSQLHQVTTESTALNQIKTVGNITSLDAQEIFFQDNVLVVEQDGAENKLVSGRVVIYELLDAPIGVWELASKDKNKVTRGDVRELLEGLTYGSTAYLRRHPQGCNVRSTPLRFSGIEGAGNFVNELSFRKDQYARSSQAIHTETSVELSPAAKHGTTVQLPDKVTRGTVVEPMESSTPKSKLGSVVPSFKTPQLEQPLSQRPNAEESELVQPKMGRDLHDVKPRPHTPPYSLFDTKGEPTTPKATAASGKQVGSGWDDKDLMSFSPEPEPDRGPSRSNGEQEAAKKSPRTHAAEEVTKALRDVKVIERADDPSAACLEVLHDIPTDYTALIQKSALLSVALDTSPLNAAFVTALLHLVEVDKFLELSRDDQKSALAHVYAIIRHGNSPIILSEKEILSLRSGEEACPKAVKELNALIKATQRQTPQGRTTQTVPGTRMLGGSPKPLGALMRSRWAMNELEETRQQHFATCGEKIPDRSPLGPPDPDGPGKASEEIVDRKAHRHERSSTVDTITILADQLGSLRADDRLTAINPLNPPSTQQNREQHNNNIMNVLLSPKPSFFHHPHDMNRRSPTRSISPHPSGVWGPWLLSKVVNHLAIVSPFHNAVPGHRKRKADDEIDEMSVSPSSSPSVQIRQLVRPAKKVRSSDPTGRPLSLPRLLETLDVTQLRTVLQTICERQPDIAEEVVKGAPRPSVECALQVLSEYQAKLQAAFPYGGSSSDYTYFRVKQPLLALIDALADFTPQYLPPNEPQAAISLQFLDGATKLVHNLPEWESQGYRHHKENAYDEISKAWALVIIEASKKGAGFVLHSDGWDQNLAKHNQQSGGRLHTAMSAMATNVGWVGGNSNSGTSNIQSNSASILDQLMAGNYVSPVHVGPW